MTVKTALITGTSRPAGLGFAVARQLAELGYHLVLTARDVSRAEPLAEQLREDGLAATALRLDLADEASMHDAAGYLTRTFGRLGALINRAGKQRDHAGLPASSRSWAVASTQSSRSVDTEMAR
jgi:NAD(P)-dependent dehydrogenase (short-subunit alcohol dehydrogenase family)